MSNPFETGIPYEDLPNEIVVQTDELLNDAMPEDTDLAAIKDAMDKTAGEGRDEDLTRSLAHDYVANNAEKFIMFQNMTQEQLVAMVDLFREQEMGDMQWLVETWLKHTYAKQRIGGKYEAQLLINGE